MDLLSSFIQITAQVFFNSIKTDTPQSDLAATFAGVTQLKRYTPFFGPQWRRAAA
jgi:hypothetical protein